MHPKSTPKQVRRYFRYDPSELRQTRSGALILPLTRGKSTLIDPEDAPLVCSMLWQSVPNGKSWTVYTFVRGDDGKQHGIKLARYLAGGDHQVDHKNGNPLDNRRQNLRPATSQQNNFNRCKTSRNTSGYKGVSRNDGPNGRWNARLNVGGVNYYLGTFDTPELAAMAVDEKAVELCGEFARLNFPRKHPSTRLPR